LADTSGFLLRWRLRYYKNVISPVAASSSPLLTQTNFMIKGTKRAEGEPDFDEEGDREQYYHTSLQSFEGVEGRAYGVMDEVHDLGKLLETIGTTVEINEKEFRQIEREEFDEETLELTPRVLANWHKKMYRQFTYKSLLLLIHTTFENGMVRFFDLLTEEGRIQRPVHKKVVVDIIRALKDLDPSIEPLIDRVRALNFVRNKVAHADGYYNETQTDYDAFKKFAATRDDIHIERLSHADGKFTHRMKIKRSTVIQEYLDVMGLVFTGLVKGAQGLEYQKVVVTS
jgi:hypothetical protein